MDKFQNNVFNCLFSVAFFTSAGVQAQTEQDAIMMNKNQFCNGFIYTYSSWENYWEGTT